MKYRIKQVDDKYFPEYRKFGFWWRWNNYYGNVWYSCLIDANQFIDSQLHVPKIKIHPYEP